MIKFICWLLGLCQHKYEIIHEVRLSTTDEVYVSTNYHCRCTLCGNMKQFKMK